ncbi:hypothetical protein QC763_120750 [Podospora pseudopauciseta]|uniref:Uncharacterized protein n=1 Tax=Podospora pseudopauciseta TaxID=2093780 RepID=A0ABR0I246_9PEZI|nr:hypothetical protein QC763_120750 [Podospora pseudopauciseta]
MQKPRTRVRPGTPTPRSCDG